MMEKAGRIDKRRAGYPSPPVPIPAYDPLAPRPRIPRIWNLSDAELRRLWPGIDPLDIRIHAPWATTRGEVRRVMGQGPLASMSDLTAFVRAAVQTSRNYRYGVPNAVEVIPAQRPPDAFRIRPRHFGPTIVDATGMVVPQPPVFVTFNSQAVERTLSWVNLATSELLRPENFTGPLERVERAVDRFSGRDLSRVIGIDVRKVPGTDFYLNQWRKDNLNLIESGLRAEVESPRLRGLIPQVSDIVRSAQNEGLRVEILAHDLIERFDVSESRAELIARDQVLKLNGQLNRHRQLSAGVEEYIWATSRDERVRESHARQHGNKFSWHAPPDTGHPGQDFQCRCQAIPVITRL